MNRSKHDSTAYLVRSRIQTGGVDRLWTYADFPKTDRMPLAAELSRLARKGELKRIRRGVYYRPALGIFGPTKPDPIALADATLRARDEHAVPTGVSVYNRLGLTTQVTNAVARATRSRVPARVLPGLRLYTVRRPLDAQKGISATERGALDALRDVDRVPGAVPAEVVTRLGALIRSGELDYVRLARYARVEPPRVRALLGAIGEALRTQGNVGKRVPVAVINDLRENLNPLTTYSISGLGEVLPNLDAWRIKA